MAAKASSLRRDLFVALLVLMTLLPLVVYFYSHQRGRALASQRLVQHVETSVKRTLEVKDQLEAILKHSGPSSRAVKDDMERVAVNEDTIAYLQLADNRGRVLNSTIAAPARDHIPDPGMPPSPEEVVQRLNSPDGGSPPEYVVDLRLTDGSRGHLLVGISAEALEDQLGRFESPLRWSALQIAVICVAMLAGFSAYIVFLNERARALLAQLQEESRLAYVGTLAAGIAHEVRNPLSSVKMNVQMMENRLKQLGDTEQADYFRGKIERIKGEVDRLEDSVSHFLTFARPQPLRLENVKLNDVVDDVLELLGPQCQSKGVGLSRKYARDLPLVAIDPRQFSQAIQNLILNALQALGRGGTITIATRAAEGAILFSVADDGPGIPEELQSQIFDVFFTTREGGTGLGLNIVSRIVEEHRGKLRLESRPGEGATFTIELSLAPEATDEP